MEWFVEFKKWNGLEQYGMEWDEWDEWPKRGVKMSKLFCPNKG